MLTYCVVMKWINSLFQCLFNVFYTNFNDSCLDFC